MLFKIGRNSKKPRSLFLQYCLLLIGLMAVIPGLPLLAAEPVIAAASDTQFALQDIAKKFQEETGTNVKLSFGSSGNFATQIMQGAPFELFLAADESYVLKLADQGLTPDQGVLYAKGRIVYFVPNDSPLKPDAQLSDLRAALSDGRLHHFAIANPEHAPYGRAAKEALETAGLWDAIQPNLVLGENVAQTAQFAASGGAQGGIFAYSLALAPSLKTAGRYALLPEQWHKPLLQRMVLLKNAGDTAKAFYRYLQQPAARTIFEQYGFTLPQ